MNLAGYTAGKPSRFSLRLTDSPHVRAIAARPVPSLPDQNRNQTSPSELEEKGFKANSNVKTLLLRAQFQRVGITK